MSKTWKECNLYKHWYTGSKIHWVWKRIRQRCNPANKHKKIYQHYAWKWIKVCERWIEFEKFYEDMWPTYEEWLTIDRINNSLGYSPENCRWSTYKQQQNNRTNNRRIAYNWETKTLQAWADEIWIDRRKISRRIDTGWTIKKAFNLI